MNTRIIEVENLSFRYGKRRAKVLEDFSMKLDKGSVYGLLGKNGTGKSTLLYLMAGLLRPQTGNVLYKGVDVKKICVIYRGGKTPREETCSGN